MNFGEKKVATNTVGSKWKQENKVWSDKECATVNEKNNCAKVRAIQIQNRTRAAKLTAINEYRQARRREKHLFRKKKVQLYDQTLIKLELHHSFQDSR
jgi:Zn-finger protein